QKRKQARAHGKFNLQLEEIPALYREKTKCLGPSCFPKTREALFFFKNNTYGPQKIDFKPPQFLRFELQLKNKPPLNRFKRGSVFMFLKIVWIKRGLCNGYPCYVQCFWIFNLFLAILLQTYFRRINNFLFAWQIVQMWEFSLTKIFVHLCDVFHCVCYKRSVMHHRNIMRLSCIQHKMRIVFQCFKLYFGVAVVQS